MNLNISFIDQFGNAHSSFTETPESQIYNGTTYIKFDGMPYELRQQILTNPLYDSSKLSFLNRKCGCGKAAFIEQEHFNQLTNNANNNSTFSMEC